ncbi:MAG: hypothetical protein AAFU81_12220 [Pseudomonadota bacterium]
MAEHMNRAVAAEVKPPLRDRISDWVKRQGGWTLLFVAFMLAGLLGITLIEASNSSSGWRKLIGDGAVPAWLAALGGFALPIFYIGYHRRAMEHWRDSKKVAAFRAGVVAILAMTLTLVGVFANISTATEEAALNAEKSNTERGLLYAEIQTLERETREERLIQEKAMLKVTAEWIASNEAEAVGWGMEPVPLPGGEEGEMTVATPAQCATDLRPRQREICNRLNGDGADEFGLRNELYKTQLVIDEIERKRGVLEEKRKEYAQTEFKTGGATWSSMETIASGTATGDTIRIWGSLIVAIMFLLAAGFGWDEFFERTEKEIGVDI